MYVYYNVYYNVYMCVCYNVYTCVYYNVYLFLYLQVFAAGGGAVFGDRPAVWSDWSEWFGEDDAVENVGQS